MTLLVMVALAAVLHLIVARYVAVLVAPARAFSAAVLVLSATPNELRPLSVPHDEPPDDGGGHSNPLATAESQSALHLPHANTRALYERRSLCSAGGYTGAVRDLACEKVEEALGRYTTVGALIMHRDAELHRARVVVYERYRYMDNDHDFWGFLRGIPPIRMVVETTDASGTRIVQRLRPTVATTHYSFENSEPHDEQELHRWFALQRYGMRQCSDQRFDRFSDVEGTLQLQVRLQPDASSPDVQIVQSELPDETGACIAEIWREVYPRSPSWSNATIRITYSFYTVVDEPGPMRRR